MLLTTTYTNGVNTEKVPDLPTNFPNFPFHVTALGPVPQSPIKPTLDYWKNPIAISLLLKKGLQQNCGPKRL